VVAVAGRNLLSDKQLTDAGVRNAYALTDIEPDVQRCIDDPGPLLERLGRRIAEDAQRTSSSTNSWRVLPVSQGGETT